MKKILFFGSLVMLTAWIITFFFLNLSRVIHIFLFLSVLFYIRYLLIAGVAGTPVDAVVTPVNNADENLA